MLDACAVQRTNRQRARFAARGASMTRTAVAILCSLAVAACTSAPMPAAWTRTDGQASDPIQLESAKTICRGEMVLMARPSRVLALNDSMALQIGSTRV